MDLNKTNTLPIGTILHGNAIIYVIKRVLGHGGFGITYLAEPNSTTANSMHTQYAIKEFFADDYCQRNGNSVEIVRNKELMDFVKERFLREAKRIASYQHPNIVKVQEVFEANNTIYYAMQYLPGGSLEDKKILSEEMAIRYIRPIALVLQEMHLNKTNHLDIKPENIMINGAGEPVLIDFGISKGYLEDGRATSVQDISAYSPGYAPPEQYGNGAKNFSPQLDIYALGATLYRLVTGQRPPISTELHDLDMQLLFPSSVSPQMQQLIKLAMQPNPWKRPETMEQYIQKIDAYSLAGDNGKTRVQMPDNGATQIEYSKPTSMRPNAPTLVEHTTEKSYNTGIKKTDRDNLVKTWGVAGVAVAVVLAGLLFLNRPESAPNTYQAEAPQTVQQHDSPVQESKLVTAKPSVTKQNTPSNTTRQDTKKEVQTENKKTATQTTVPRQTASQAPVSQPTSQPATQPATPAVTELSADELLQKGMSAYRKFNYENAAKYFLQAADKGNVSAFYQLGDLYYNGNGVNKSLPTAKKLFTTAAGQGHKEAQYMLGVMFRNGQGGEKNIQQAKLWLQKAAYQGHSKAARLLDSL